MRQRQVGGSDGSWTRLLSTEKCLRQLDLSAATVSLYHVARPQWADSSSRFTGEQSTPTHVHNLLSTQDLHG